MDKKINFCEIDVIARAKEYREPVLVWGKDVVVSFYAYDPEIGRLRRKRVKLNRELKNIEGKRAQRDYASGVVRRIREELSAGYNPWIHQSRNLVYTRFEDACELYKRYLEKQLNEHNMREDSVASYMSYLRVLRAWAEGRGRGMKYAYQFDKAPADEEEQKEMSDDLVKKLAVLAATGGYTDDEDTAKVLEKKP